MTAPSLAQYFGRTMVLGGIGFALIACGLAISAVIKPAAEAYSMEIADQCRDQIIAASLVQLHGLQCPGAADYGHSEASIALCGLAGGRTPRQVARLPICAGVVPRLEIKEGAP